MKPKARSLVTLIATLGIIIIISYLSTFYFFRLDLTSENRYTLTDVTRSTLKNLENPVFVNVYLTGDDLPPGFNELEKAIRHTLEEFTVYAGQQIQYKFIDPTESGDKEERARLYKDLKQKGLRPVELTQRTRGDKTSKQTVFPGVVINYNTKHLAVNLLKDNMEKTPTQNLNNSIQALEYEFLNAIKKITTDKRKRIGLTTGHGEPSNKRLSDLASILSEYYDVERVPVTDTIKTKDLGKYAALLIVKPDEKFTEKEKFRIDQYFMDGGKLFWFIDGVKTSMDSLRSKRTTIGIANELNLNDLLFKYGVRVNHDLVLDQQCLPIGLTQRGVSGKNRIQKFPWYYNPLIIPSQSKNNHPVTKYLNPVRTEFVSTIDTVGSNRINKKVLLQSSELSLVKGVPVRISFNIINNPPARQQFNDGSRIVAVSAEGVFSSVFRNRMITEEFTQNQEFREKSKQNKMIVVSDGDIPINEVSSNGEVYPVGFDRNSRRNYKGNADFIRNAVNYLTDNEGLMKLRLRDLKIRLLDKQLVQDERTKWQIINTAVPVLIVILIGLTINFIRKRKYTR